MADVVITPANVQKSTTSSTDRGTAGATITAGMQLYKDATDSYKLKPAIASSLASAAAVGAALHGASNGQPVEYTTDGLYTAGGTLVIGQVYCVSAAVAGATAPYADLVTGNFVTIMGGGQTASLLKLKINALGVAKP